MARRIDGRNSTSTRCDYFHELILFDDLPDAVRGVLWGLLEGVHIGLPPVLNFGSEELRRRVGRPVLQGKSIICLCITEPYAGSDVANIRSAAKERPNWEILYSHRREEMDYEWYLGGLFHRCGEDWRERVSGISLLVIEKSR